MPHQVAVTGKTGPDRLAMNTVLTNVSGIDFNFNDRRIYIHQDNLPHPGTELEIGNAPIVTFTYSGGNWSVVIS